MRARRRGGHRHRGWQRVRGGAMRRPRPRSPQAASCMVCMPPAGAGAALKAHLAYYVGEAPRGASAALLAPSGASLAVVSPRPPDAMGRAQHAHDHERATGSPANACRLGLTTRYGSGIVMVTYPIGNYYYGYFLKLTRRRIRNQPKTHDCNELQEGMSDRLFFLKEEGSASLATPANELQGVP